MNKNNKKIEIRGLFFEDIDDLFTSSIHKVAKESHLSAKEFQNKLDEKFDEITEFFDES